MDRAGAGIPCLVEENKAAGEIRYTVAAVQSSDGDSGKEWVCVQLVLMEKAAAYFLAGGWMGDIAGVQKHAIILPAAEKDRMDFEDESTCVEERTFMPASGRHKNFMDHRLFLSADYLLRCCVRMQKRKRMVCLAVCQQGTQRVPDLTGQKTKESLKNAAESGVEFWVAETKIEADGIRLLSYHDMTDCILRGCMWKNEGGSFVR